MPPRIVVAPDKFKECLTAQAVGEAISEGIREAIPDAIIDLAPMADGGDGTVDAILAAIGGERVRLTATGPLGDPVECEYGWLASERTAVIEAAAVAGLALTPPNQRDPTRTTTRGLGELISLALDAGARRIMVGIGGTATNDGGVGMAECLGYRFLDSKGRNLPPGGASLLHLDRIDRDNVDPRLRDVDISVACDVSNPLCGPNGASRVFGPQKGASPEMVMQLDAALARLACVALRDLQFDMQSIEGGGAAGGLGAGLAAFTGARLRNGFEWISGLLRLSQRLQSADLVFTGEGKYDGTSRFGKVVHGILGLHGANSAAVVALVGVQEVESDDSRLIVLPIAPGPMDRDTAIREAAIHLRRAAASAVRLWLAGRLSIRSAMAKPTSV